MSMFDLIARNMLRNRTRALMTVSAIALATALVCLMMTMPAGFDRLLSSLSSETRVAVHAKAGFVYAMPPAYLNKVRALPGVAAASSATWFGGLLDPNEGVKFASFAVDPDEASQVFSDYPVQPGVFDAFRHLRQGALVGRQVLASQRWKVGDTVTLSSPSYDVTLEFKIVGAIDDPANGNFWFQRPYLEETLRARGSEMTGIGTVWVRVADKGRVIPVMREIEAALAGGEVPVATETERDFNAGLYGGLQGIIGMTLFVTFIVSLAIVFIGANTASMTVRERAPEIAVLRALGFPRRTLFVLLIAESTLLAACAGTLGVALALGVTALLRSGMDEAGGLVAMLQSFQVGPSIAALGLLLASAVGVLSALLPAYGAARRNVVTTLREVF